jgi:bifunctional non-homologous end joining protein LigD
LISGSIAKLKAQSAVLDMEAVVLDRNGKSNFQAMQQAPGEGGSPQSIQAYVFDVLELNGRDMTREGLMVRKKALEVLLKKSKDSTFLHYGDHVTGHGGDMIQQSSDMGLEGTVSKRVDAPYQPGRQKSWLKSKCVKRQEFVIIGYTAARRGSRAMGALHLSYRLKGKFRYAGKVGTGFGMKDAQELYDLLSKPKTSVPAVEGFPRMVSSKPQAGCSRKYSAKFHLQNGQRTVISVILRFGD